MTTITVLNAFEEEEALRRMKNNARSLCQKEIEEFARCSSTGTFSIAWNCSKIYKAMNNCLKSYSADEDFDHYREQVLSEKIQRLKTLGVLDRQKQEF